MTAPTDLTAVIVTYNSAAVIERCLSALPTNMPVIVVDNDSTDDTLTRVEVCRPATMLIQQGYNSGFGRACNRGLRSMETGFGILINPDTVISGEGLSALEEGMRQQPDVAVLAPRFTSDPAAITQSPVSPKIEDRAFVLGAGMVLRRSAFPDETYFDERIFLYSEDNDICVSTRRRGHRVACAVNVVALHRGGESTDALENDTSDKVRIMARSAAFVILKHAGGRRYPAVRKMCIYGWHGITFGLSGRRKESRLWFARAGGILDVLRFGPDVLWDNRLTGGVTGPREQDS
ncbi:MAG: glycosyltransferase family 2 protein [Pseudomonadota bacterium]